MKIEVKQITEGTEQLILHYKEPTPVVEGILQVLGKADAKLWGKVDDQSISIQPGEILYLESVDDKVFAYTASQVVRLEGSLTSFLLGVGDEAFFRCSKSMVLNINRVTALHSLSGNRIDATMEGGEHIIISRRYAVEFRRLLKGGRGE